MASPVALGSKIRVEVPALQAWADAARLTHDRPVIALVAERERDAALAALVWGIESAGGRVASLRASLRASAGFQLEPSAVFTHPDAAREALVTALAALPPHDVLVAEGALACTALRAALTVAVVASESPALFSRDLRAVRDRVDLFLFDARAAVLARLAERVLAERIGLVVASRA